MVKRKSVHTVLMLLTCIFVCLLAGIIGSLFTVTGPDSWYENLVKPVFNPPNWIFGPVWTTLYILMGIAIFLALRKKVSNKGKVLFISQLILNTLWSIIFFGMHQLFLSVLIIIALWILILLNIMEFYKKSKTAAYLLLPYIAWVSFAMLLNISICILNF